MMPTMQEIDEREKQLREELTAAWMFVLEPIFAAARRGVEADAEIAQIRDALTGDDYASLPSDLPTVRMAHTIRADHDKFRDQVRDTCQRAEKAEAELAAIKAAQPERVSIDMVLYCPKCNFQHIDAPDERTPDWKNPPHKSHLCHKCGHIWRPSDTPTNGIAAVPSGKDADTAPRFAAQPERDQGGADGMNVYTVIAYKGGDRDGPSYTVGVFSTDTQALRVADEEEQERGWKWTCEVEAHVVDLTNKQAGFSKPNVIKRTDDTRA